MRVLVTGGRRFSDVEMVRAAFDRLDISELAHGKATGADTLSALEAGRRGIPLKEFPADWQGECRSTCRPGHRRTRRGGGTYCPAAGAYRNQQMLDEFRPDVLLAFPGGKGTADMMDRATAAGVTVLPAEMLISRG